MLTPMSEVVAALEAAWRRVQELHPEVPDVVLMIGAGDVKPGRLRWGHFWEGRWKVGSRERGEVMISGESLSRPAAETFCTLLHEATHGLSAARGVADTSRGGRYHNPAFREHAVELGLEVERDNEGGWRRTTLPAATRARYRKQIEAIEAAQKRNRRAHRRLPESIEPSARGKRGGDAPRKVFRVRLHCTCAPARLITVAPGVSTRGGIRCDECGDLFDVRD